MEKELTWSEYQEFVVSTKRYSENYRLLYPVLGLASEAGEVAGKLKKILRDNNGEISEEQAGKLFDELSDVLWYVTCCLDDLGLSLEALAHYNVAKLTSRADRGVIQGDGDNR
jgi:NTP pyrophosphatase (non-canonical NTP hydrolase)